MAGEALSEVFASFGIKFDNTQLQRGTASIKSAITGVKAFGAALAGAAVIRGISSFIKSMMATASSIGGAPRRLGMTVSEFQGVSHAANMAGVDTAAFSQAMLYIQRNAMEAAEGSASARAAFEELGVTVQNQDGTLRNSREIFLEMADGMRNLEDPNRRTGLAMTLMGRSGARMVGVLSQGSEAIEAQGARARELTGDLTEFVGVSRDLRRSIVEYNASILGLKARMASVMMPIIARAIRIFTQFNATIRQFTENPHVWQIALAALGVAAIATGIKMTIAFAGPLLTFGLIAAAILIAILALDDLWTTLEGGESVLQGFIDEAFGIGTTARLVADLQTAFHALLVDILAATQAITSFLDSFTGAQLDFLIGPEPEERYRVRAPQRGQKSQLIGSAAQTYRDRTAITPPERGAKGQLFGDAATAARERARAAGSPGAASIGAPGPVTARAPQVTRNTTISAPSEVNVTIQAQGANADQVARLAQRRVEESLERQRRQTIQALESADDSEFIDEGLGGEEY